jgi:16S rRNA (guanine966-N2)-methyltransferase
MPSTTHARGARARSLRIIAGAWRGRRWRFPDTDLRPTPDRVRETLFNWLQDRVPGARCLDLFAGSGALGLEALSRGAADVVFVETDRKAARSLQELLAAWQAPRGHVIEGDALRLLAGPPRTMNLVFLDPPFAAGLLSPAAAALTANGWLAEGALIYVEHAADEHWQPPASWQLLRSGAAGAVGYHVYQFRSAREQAS